MLNWAMLVFFVPLVLFSNLAHAEGDCPDGSLTFEKTIKEFMAVNCTTCHGAALGTFERVNILDYRTAYRLRDVIQRNVDSGRMPLYKPLDAKDRAIIDKWVEGGAKFNCADNDPPNSEKWNSIHAITYNNTIKHVFERHCTNCHYPKAPRLDLTDYAVVVKNKDQIIQKVVINRSMPIPPVFLSDAERAQLADWISDGLKK